MADPATLFGSEGEPVQSLAHQDGGALLKKLHSLCRGWEGAAAVERKRIGCQAGKGLLCVQAGIAMVDIRLCCEALEDFACPGVGQQLGSKCDERLVKFCIKWKR